MPTRTLVRFVVKVAHSMAMSMSLFAFANDFLCESRQNLKIDKSSAMNKL